MSRATTTPAIGREPERFSIGELARLVGAAPSALRYWERAGLLSPEREHGERRYRVDAVVRVGLIRLCQQGGFGIGEIRRLVELDPDGSGPWRSAVEAKLDETRSEIARLQGAAADLECVLSCTSPSLATCPDFAAVVEDKARGATADVAVRPAELQDSGHRRAGGPGRG